MADERASDHDRQRVIDELRRHTADGRLTLDEFEERVEEALRARTHADLVDVLRELPQPVSARSTAPEPVRRAQRRRRVGLPTPVLVVLLVVGGSIAMGHFAWWLIPVGFWVTGGGHCGARRQPARI